jgi:cell division protein FtsB
MQTYKIKKYKSLIIFIALSILASLCWIFFSPYGAKNYTKINSDVEKLSADIEALTIQNNALQDEIVRLKGDSRYVEDLARKKYGLLKKNEMVFEFNK